MNKGFTLAEVLITLSIIGVVAALTTPALIQNTASAKVGPALRKAVSSFESANALMLAEEDATSITSLTKGDTDEYIKNLSKYLKLDASECLSYSSYKDKSKKISVNDVHYKPYSVKDGIIYYFFHNFNKEPVSDTYADIPHNQKLGELLIDINGASGPNRDAKDLFHFVLYNDGSLMPYGAKGYDKSTNSLGHYWAHTTNGCNASSVGYSATCAGAIFENGMKLIYEK